MRDPEQTRKTIIEAAGILFNTKGYKATSLSDITSATRLTKGAIYRHFQDKSELEKQALMHMLGIMMMEMRRVIKAAGDAPTKLNAVLDYFDRYRVSPPFNGGCPLMNAAIEVDDSDPILKAVVHDTMGRLHEAIVIIIKNGIKYKQLKKDVDVQSTASLIFSAIEGGIMLMQIMNDDRHLASVIKHLRNQIDKMSI